MDLLFVVDFPLDPLDRSIRLDRALALGVVSPISK